MAVWDAEPGTAGAEQLDYKEATDSFQVLTHIEQFDRFDRKTWEKSSHNLGKSYLDPDNIDIVDGVVRIRIPAGTKDGGEFGTKASYSHGTYRASIQVAPIHGVVTGFFLYHGADGSGDEIDIELYYEDEWYVAFTTWSNGDMTGTEKKRLKYDPSAAFHEYRIDYYSEQVTFLVDDRQMHVFRSGLPDEPMRLLVNSWFPDWLHGHSPREDTYTTVDWIQY
jgi:beta-glucanase (GH16 family)